MNLNLVTVVVRIFTQIMKHGKCSAEVMAAAGCCFRYFVRILFIFILIVAILLLDVHFNRCAVCLESLCASLVCSVSN